MGLPFLVNGLPDALAGGRPTVAHVSPAGQWRWVPIATALLAGVGHLLALHVLRSARAEYPWLVLTTLQQVKVGSMPFSSIRLQEHLVLVLQG